MEHCGNMILYMYDHIHVHVEVLIDECGLEKRRADYRTAEWIYCKLVNYVSKICCEKMFVLINFCRSGGT